MRRIHKKPNSVHTHSFLDKFILLLTVVPVDVGPRSDVFAKSL